MSRDTYRVRCKFTDVEADELMKVAENSAKDLDYVLTIDSRLRRRSLERAIQKLSDRIEAGQIRGDIPRTERSPRQ